jgi:hypothetical protein
MFDIEVERRQERSPPSLPTIQLLHFRKALQVGVVDYYADSLRGTVEIRALLLERFDYREKLLIMSLVITFRRDHLPRLECNRVLLRSEELAQDAR